MTGPSDVSVEELAKVGLCTRCKQAKRVVSSKNSTFWLCQRSRIDERYSKYPRLPVVRCAGHEHGDPE
jgi:hypothetical protein